ncbi:MAG TPA: sigma-70 family RNA polymerase sigma factor, partial [Chryseosolibacter sp.]|nr:sigma-70 family RNA polymerase sigma factor [Chryseosolibacter sp.]
MGKNKEPIPHLFRTEYRKIVAVLTRRFGLNQLGLAEDIASETFLTASQSWGVQGLPENPVAWLYQVARNKALNHLRRRRTFEKSVVPGIESNLADDGVSEIDLSAENIFDSQLQMIFAVCNPAIPPEAQTGLALRVLCGFGIDEIADAFLTNKETINKRLFRAKEIFREKNISLSMPGTTEIDTRLSGVVRTIYLLFNEGYYSHSHDRGLRKELALEAIRLCTMLVEHPATNRPQVNALLALMCFHASRFDSRIGANGEV